MSVSGSLVPGAQIQATVTGCPATGTTSSSGSVVFPVNLSAGVQYPARVEFRTVRCGLIDTVNLANAAQGSGNLAVTGAESGNLAQVGAALAVVGGVLVLAVRKRRLQS